MQELNPAVLSASGKFNIIKQGHSFLENLELDAAGPFQQKNLATLVQAWDLLRHQINGLDESALRTGLKNLKKLTRFIGRWEIKGGNPTILCDSAHNEAGLRLAFEKIKTMPYKNLHVVTGFVNDKSVEKVLGLFPKEAPEYSLLRRIFPVDWMPES